MGNVGLSACKQIGFTLDLVSQPNYFLNDTTVCKLGQCNGYFAITNDPIIHAQAGNDSKT